MKSKIVWLSIFMVLAFVLVACTTSAAAPESTPVDETDNGAEIAATETTVPTETAATEAAVEEIGAGTAVPTTLPPYPLNITFTADDGTELIGHYWAPASENVPVVVLMHQYPMDHNIEWIAIAPWLQNRGLIAAVRTGGEPWSDPTWFVRMVEGLDFAVFSFTFRNCEGGCSEDSVQSREEWVVDAVSAIKAAASFNSVDPERIVVLGTSIGADAAVDACARLAEDPEAVQCKGVVSISPASWLEIDYAETVTALDEAGVEVRCIASEQDGITADTCRSFEGEHYASLIDPGQSHGVRMFDPSLEVDIPVLLLQWLIDWTQ